MKTPEFKSKKDQYKWLVENKSEIITEKKSAIKHADSILVNIPMVTKVVDKSKVANKEVNKVNDDNELQVKVIINTTNLMDSHSDVHLKGIWDESLVDGKKKLHLQEHEMKFDKIISETPDNLEVSTKEYTWQELGYSYKGSTEALVFDSTILKERNPFMYNQYKNKFVTNHSVGMKYVNIDLAINDPEYQDEFDTWNKHIEDIANKEYVESKGYFWAVTKANFLEGSAVPIGSNSITPTLAVETKTVVEPVIIKTEEPQLQDVINNADVLRLKTLMLKINK